MTTEDEKGRGRRCGGDAGHVGGALGRPQRQRIWPSVPERVGLVTDDVTDSTAIYRPWAADVCALGRIRTCDTRFRKPMLYPLSYEGGRQLTLPAAEMGDDGVA